MTWRDGRLVSRAVRRISAVEGEEMVFNLQVGNPNTFVAEGVVVHNKGGGCFRQGRRSETPHGQVPIESSFQAILCWQSISRAD